MATTTHTTTTHPTATTLRDAHAPDHHVHGTMDVRGHERMFDGFVKFMAWNAVICLLILVFLALVNA